MAMSTSDEPKINDLKLGLCVFAAVFCEVVFYHVLLKRWEWYRAADLLKILVPIFIASATPSIVRFVVHRGKPEGFVKWVTK